MTPLKIEIVLFYFARMADHPFMVGDAPIRDQVEAELLADGLIQRGQERRFEPTDRARAYVEALMAMPLPVQRWVMPDVGGSNG